MKRFDGITSKNVPEFGNISNMAPSRELSGEKKLALILVELDSSKAAYQTAIVNVQRAIQLSADLEGVNPDGTVPLRSANRSARQAMERYHDAIKRFDEYLGMSRKSTPGAE